MSNPTAKRKKGSPPQVRGKRSEFAFRHGVFGITPAGAGKTYHGHEALGGVQDHPRRCGENALFRGYVGCISGSPPQVRGKQICVENPVPSKRITPAGAGKTPAEQALIAFKEDHPRRCGENTA